MILAWLTGGTVGRILMAVAVGAALVSGVYWYAHQQGRAAERLDALNRSIELLRERNLTDEQIGAMDDAGLCAALGGRWVPVDGTCQ